MGKHDSAKQPRLAVEPSGEKVPRIAAEPNSYNHLKASWRVSSVQMSAPYGWHQLTATELAHVRERLSAFETMTWNEIFVQSKKHNHPIAVADLRCPKARKWMETKLPDENTLWTLRFSGAERVWGIFSEGAYRIVFWDPRHEIYPSTR